MRQRQAKKRRKGTEERQLKGGGDFMLLNWKAGEAKMFSLSFSNTVPIRGEARVSLGNYSVVYFTTHRIQATVFQYQDNEANPMRCYTNTFFLRAKLNHFFFQFFKKKTLLKSRDKIKV